MQADFTIVPALGKNLDAGLNFRAHGLHIDNPTNQWWYIPSSQQRVPPYTMSVQMALDGTAVASAILENPPGQVSAPLPDEITSFNFTDVTLADSAGFSLGNQATLVPQNNNVQTVGGQHTTNTTSAGVIPAVPGFAPRIISYGFSIKNPGSQFASLIMTIGGTQRFRLDCPPRGYATIEDSNDSGLFTGLANSVVTLITQGVTAGIVQYSGLYRISYMLVPA